MIKRQCVFIRQVSQQTLRLRLSQLLYAFLAATSSYFVLPAAYDLYVENSPPREIGPSIKYVSLCEERLEGDHRTGNHLFMLAAMLYIARLTNRRVAMPSKGWNLDNDFDLDVTRVGGVWRDLCPCLTLRTPAYDFDDRLNDQAFVDSLRSTQRTLLLCGLSQSWRYPSSINPDLRRTLHFTPNTTTEAKQFHRALVARDPPSFTPRQGKSVYRVGVHVRRGDFLAETHAKYGLTVADAGYLRRAFEHFERRHGRVRFVVTSNDFEWTLANLPAGADVVIANHSGPTDLAILAACDAVIISTGSYGWWAAWLGHKPAVYYASWPRQGSKFEGLFNRTNYFPPHWKPLL